MTSVQKWKPGDMAVVEAGCWANRKVALRLAEGWAHVNGVNLDADGVVAPVRPLVVIDPEDSEQVERLAQALKNAYWGAGSSNVSAALVDAMQAALREFANPTPQIEEPTGLGAVVELVGGDVLVRVETAHLTGEWRDRYDTLHSWPDLDVAKVLSPGWTVQP